MIQRLKAGSKVLVLPTVTPAPSAPYLKSTGHCLRMQDRPWQLRPKRWYNYWDRSQYLREMDELIIGSVNSKVESMELDYLLWEVLWKPLGLSRSFRGSLKLDGESLELVVKADSRVVGGLVANWIDDSEVEIRHIALKPEVQNRGVGRRLVASLISTVSGQGCLRIQTVARSTSVGFFRKLDFVKSPCRPPEHPDFKRHGITFVLMEKKVEQPSRGDAVNHACQP